jgi:hypothetical protein
MTRCVGQAWEQFSSTRKEVVVQSFRKLGMSLPIDGSCDAELSIKGLDPEVLRSGLKDWRTRGCHQEQDDYSDSESSEGEDLGHLMESFNFDSNDESEIAPSHPIMGNDSTGSAVTNDDSSGSAIGSKEPSSPAEGAAPVRGNRRGRPRGRAGRQALGISRCPVISGLQLMQKAPVTNDDSTGSAVTHDDSTGSAVTNDDSSGSAIGSKEPSSPAEGAAPVRGNRRGRPRGRAGRQPGRQALGISQCPL